MCSSDLPRAADSTAVPLSDATGEAAMEKALPLTDPVRIDTPRESGLKPLKLLTAMLRRLPEAGARELIDNASGLRPTSIGEFESAW